MRRFKPNLLATVSSRWPGARDVYDGFKWITRCSLVSPPSNFLETTPPREAPALGGVSKDRLGLWTYEMRIAHYFFRVSEASGGVSRAIYDLVTLLASAGHEVTLFTGANSQFPEDWDFSQRKTASVVMVEPPPSPMQLLSRRSLSRLSTHLREMDVLHLHGLWRPAISQVARLARQAKKHYVLTSHGALDKWSMRYNFLKKRLYYYILERRNLREASFVHCTAAKEAEQSRRWIPHDRIVTIPYAIDLAPYQQLPSPDLFELPPLHLLEHHTSSTDGRPVVLYLSRLHPKKGAETLIRAVGALSDQGIECHLWLAGTGEAHYVRRLKRMCKKIFPTARFLGLVTGTKKLSLYRRADVLALPTLQENFGLVLTEALACGTPVVTTRGTDISQQLESSGGAMIVEPLVSAFSDALGNLLSDPEKRHRMGHRGRQWIFRWLEPERITAMFVRLYREALQQDRR